MVCWRKNRLRKISMSRDMMIMGLDWRTPLDGDGVGHLVTFAPLVKDTGQAAREVNYCLCRYSLGRLGKLVCFNWLTTFIVHNSVVIAQATHPEAAFQGFSLVFMTKRPVIGAERKNSDFELKKVIEILFLCNFSSILLLCFFFFFGGWFLGDIGHLKQMLLPNLSFTFIDFLLSLF